MRATSSCTMLDVHCPESLRSTQDIGGSFPTKEGKMCTSFGIYCLVWAHVIHFKAPIITHNIQVPLLLFSFHIEYTYGVIKAIIFFIFPDLSLAAGYEAAMMNIRCNTEF